MPLSEAYTRTALTVSTVELSLVSGTSALQAITTAGSYQLWLDAANMAKGDEFQVRVIEAARAAGTGRELAEFSLKGVQTEVFFTQHFILLNGWDFTIKKIAGTDRAFDASIRKAA